MGALGTAGEAGTGTPRGGVAEGAGSAAAGVAGAVVVGAAGAGVVGAATGGATGCARASGGAIHGTSAAARIQRDAARVRGIVSVRTRMQ